MGRWFRVHDDLVDDPKVQLLSGDLVKTLLNLWCLASQNDGVLPPMKDMAFKLRMKPAQVAAVIAELAGAGLIDRDGQEYRPHNWDKRQYKSDVDKTAADRAKRYRAKSRDANASVTRDGSRDANACRERPETEADTEQKQITEANASGALAPTDPRTRLFREGLADLAEMTGKGPDACRSFVGKCLQAASDDAVVVLGLIDDAKRNRVANPSAWIAARLKPAVPPSRVRTAHQQERETGREILNALRDASSRANFELQRHDTGDGSEGFRGGVRGALIDLSAARDREGHEPVQRSAGDGELSKPGKVSGAS